MPDSVRGAFKRACHALCHFHHSEDGDAFAEAAAEVRKTSSWLRNWANFSLF
jgi:hypothetical protein